MTSGRDNIVAMESSAEYENMAMGFFGVSPGRGRQEDMERGGESTKKSPINDEKSIVAVVSGWELRGKDQWRRRTDKDEIGDSKLDQRFEGNQRQRSMDFFKVIVVERR